MNSLGKKIFCYIIKEKEINKIKSTVVKICFFGYNFVL